MAYLKSLDNRLSSKISSNSSLFFDVSSFEYMGAPRRARPGAPAAAVAMVLRAPPRRPAPRSPALARRAALPPAAASRGAHGPAPPRPGCLARCGGGRRGHRAMGGAMSGATGAAGGHTPARPPAAAAMGPREPRHRLEAVLGALYDLGEEPGGGRRAAEDGEARAVPPTVEEEEEEQEERREPQPAAGGRRGARGFFGELRAELSAAGPAPPAPAGPPAVEVVVFRGRKRKERHGPSAAPAGTAQTQIVNEEKNAVRQEFNFEKARLEVHKFGITGYKKQEQRVWERERAIMLGAKPPKKAHMNYRTYQEKLKEKKAVKDADKEKEHKGDSLKKKKQKEQKERKAKRKKSVPSIWPAGQVGKFRNGTLILQSRDIKKIKSSKVSK